MRIALSLLSLVVIGCGVLAQRAKLTPNTKPKTTALLTSDQFDLSKTGVLQLRGETNQFLLLPSERFPGEIRSLTILDFDEGIYVARFVEAGGVGVEGFFDVCFQVRDGMVFTRPLELGASIERLQTETFARSSAYVFDKVDKAVLKVKFGSPSALEQVQLTNRAQLFKFSK